MPSTTSPRGALPACLIFLSFTLLCFGFYHARTLQGDINHHILAGEMFGVPADLKARGLEPLYHGKGMTGWDGQFYYYMANDILALKDTPQHIDAPSYRYQRIGLSLYTAVVAKLLGRDWVSPSLFFWSYLGLLLVAVWAGARLFQRLGASPYLILLWALGVGPQITLFNALPDAAADAFMIIGLSALCASRVFLGAILFSMAGLAREVYVLFPAFILLSHAAGALTGASASGASSMLSGWRNLLRWHRWYWLLLPGLVVVAWRCYVELHFGVSPAQQADGILGMPLQAWTSYFISGVRGHHLFAPVQSYQEAMCLLLFLVVLILAMGWALSRLRRGTAGMSPEVRGMVWATLALVALYASFGYVVIMHYTGYYKAVVVFFFLIPFLMSQQHDQAARLFRTGGVAILVLALVLPQAYNLDGRILLINDDIDEYTHNSMVTRDQSQPCLKDPSASWQVKHVSARSWGSLASLFGRRGVLIVDIELTNTGREAWVSTRAPGGIYMSYQWVDGQGKVVTDGVRSALLTPLEPGQSRALTLVVKTPRRKGNSTLRLSPVQEQCAWFYRANPALPAGL
jgi:hypothetical protein